MAILQRQVDELDELKAVHYAEIVEHEEEVWDVVQAKVCMLQVGSFHCTAQSSSEDLPCRPLDYGCL